MCVFWEGGRGDAQGPPATLQLTSKGCGEGGVGRAGVPQPLPPPPPLLPRGEGVSFGLLVEGAEGPERRLSSSPAPGK